MNDTNERSVASAGSVETKRERFDLYGSVAHAHNLAAYVLAAKAAQECEAEIARLRLTDAEREAIEVAARFMDKWGGVPNTIASDTLRGLLERLK